MKLTGILTTILTFLLISTSTLLAQPSPAQLADQISDRNMQRLANIETLFITVEPEGGGLIPATTTKYVKKTEGGRTWLEPEDEDYDTNTGLLSGVFDDQMPKLVRSASSVEREQLDGYSVYKIFVDDADLLNEMMDDDMEFAEDEVKNITIWIDSDELVARKVRFDQISDEGHEMIVEVIMSDYQNHSGLPIAHSIQFNIEGLDAQFTEEDRAEARRAMAELEEQLAQMPEAQRRMIEEQMKPQLERFEAMLESGEMGRMVLRVTDVRVNQ
ncbi:MAG: hypothetical protein EA390_14090 [Balneolaceae bacterium]|nr:MAG: hypothetical protein EA390_14090 [Balneolaceae bacterium]